MIDHICAVSFLFWNFKMRSVHVKAIKSAVQATIYKPCLMCVGPCMSKEPAMWLIGMRLIPQEWVGPT